jgi:RNA polymerase sigma-70 factor (ECF subfamily)
MKPSGPTDFDSTRWTLIEQVRSDSSSDRRAALDELLRRYLPALQAHLMVRRGMQAQDAADLVQDFATNKILERDLVARADRTRGRFRAFLLTALDRYFVDRFRYRNAQKRAAAETFSLDSSGGETPGESEVDVFDIAWGRTVLKESLQNMKRGCEEEHALRTWETFRLRVLEPIVSGTPPIDYESLIRLCGFESPRQASNALITARRRFFRCLRDVVAEYATSEEELEEELTELHEIMSVRGAFNRDLLPFEIGWVQDGLVESPDVDTPDASELAHLFAYDESKDHPWQDHELGQLLRHLLETPITYLLSGTRVTQVPATWTHRRLSELFTASDPPLSLLEHTKNIGRAWVNQETGTMPSDLGVTLYFASIATALVRHGQRITSSPDRTLFEGFRRVTKKPWMEPRLREILHSGAERLQL